MKSVYKMYTAYFHLTNFGWWNKDEACESNCTIKKPAQRLFDCENDVWINTPASRMTIYSNGTYLLIGAMSYFDREVMESLKFKKL